jgi:hypothetical protein
MRTLPTFKTKRKIYGLLGRQFVAKQTQEQARDREVFAAKEREADAATKALIAESEAEEAQSDHQKGSKGKGGKGGKKKRKGGNSKQGPSQGAMKKGGGDEEKEEGNAGKRDSGRQDLKDADGRKKEEEEMHSGGHEQHENQQKEKEGDTTMADIAAATGKMTLAEGRGDNNTGEQSITISATIVLTEDDLWDAAPDEYKCPLEKCLLTEDCVLASDGFMYSKKGLERWIAHWEANGLPLTSPKTGEVMEAAFMINKPY